MSEIITLYGLRKLASMKVRPENYKEMVLNYLQHKQDWINSGHSTPHNVDVFIEAVNIARRIDVIWKITKLSY